MGSEAASRNRQGTGSVAIRWRPMLSTKMNPRVFWGASLIIGLLLLVAIVADRFEAQQVLQRRIVFALLNVGGIAVEERGTAALAIQGRLETHRIADRQPRMEADAAIFFLVSFFMINPFVLHSLMYCCRLVYYTTWFYGESLYPYIYNYM